VILSSKVLKVDPATVEAKIRRFIKDCVTNAGAKGVVVGMSGGVDSSLTAALCTRALGGKRVLGISLPEIESDPRDVKYARKVAKSFGIKHIVIDMTPVVQAILQIIPQYTSRQKITSGNIKARVRMIILYYYANKMKRLVIGTGNKSEFLTGYFTKYGDSGVDILPLADLYKFQVKQLATHMGIPREIIMRPPTAGLWLGQLDEAELGVKYDMLDLILYGLEHKIAPNMISKELDIPPSLVLKIINRCKRTEHKRRGPLTLKLS
jgi:NAD+ synthase